MRALSSTGWTEGEAKYDGGLEAHTQTRPAPRRNAPLSRLGVDLLASSPGPVSSSVARVAATPRAALLLQHARYDGQGYWLAQKRLSKGRFVWWPESDDAAKQLEAYEALLLFAAGDVARVRAAPMWRRVNVLK